MWSKKDSKKGKPKKLYRGIDISRNELNNSKLFQQDDMYPFREPYVDEEGRNIVGDGNEYGIYMTDNKIAAKKDYQEQLEPDIMNENLYWEKTIEAMRWS